MAYKSNLRPMRTSKSPDLLALAMLLWRNIIAIALAAVIVASVSFGYTVMTVSPTYSATASLYVNNSTLSIGSTSVSVSAGQLSTSSYLVNTYIWVLKSRETLESIAADAGVSYSASALSGMISTATVDDTAGFTVTVTSHDPTEAATIANSICTVLPDRITEIVDGSTVRVVDHAIIPSGRSGPSYLNSTIKGALIGAVLMSAFILARGFINESQNQVIRGTEELKTLYELPVLASIPDMRLTRSKGYAGGKKSGSSAEKKGA